VTAADLQQRLRWELACVMTRALREAGVYLSDDEEHKLRENLESLLIGRIRI